MKVVQYSTNLCIALYCIISTYTIQFRTTQYNRKQWPFLVVDTRSVETTIAVGQNMQMCHSLRCKQIDRSTGTQLKSIQ